MKKVLIIAQRFPPAGGVGTFRVAKFVKFLREYNWEPVVVTVKERYYHWIDKSLEKNVPANIHIYRLSLWKTSFINDKGLRWIPYLMHSIKSIIAKENPKITYLTGGPFFPLVLGPVIKQFFNIPYVIDLRDPWKLAKRARAIRGIKAHIGKLLTNILEPLIIRSASKVICATESMRQEYIVAYKKLANKFVTITNGYDPEDFEHLEQIHFSDFTVVYAGKFRTSEVFRDPKPFFEAINVLHKKGLDIHFVHMGVTEPEIVDIAQTAGVSNFVTFIGPKSYNESLAYMKGANLLLVIGGGRKTEQTGKIFDYMGCQRPILALAPSDGEIARVISEIPFAKVMDSQNPLEIAEVIEEMHRNNFDTSGNSVLPKKYERRHLTRILARVLNEVIS